MRWVATAIVVTGLASGCTSRTSAARISELELPEPAYKAPDFDQQRVLLRRFTDARPDEYARAEGGGFFYRGYSSEYTTAYRTRGKRRQSTMHLGWLPSDLPYLLARSLPGDNVAVADELSDAGAGQRWDYVVEGRLLKTRHSSKGSFVLMYLGLIGVPAFFERYQLSYELQLFSGTYPSHPILTRTYEFDERVAVGLYYNHKRSEDLPLEALKTTLARSARDLVQEVAKHRARVR